MKYTRLTKEQIESLHEEFAKFLATQSIDKKQWEALKSSNSVLVDEELDLFSDMIWNKYWIKPIIWNIFRLTLSFCFIASKIKCILS